MTERDPLERFGWALSYVQTLSPRQLWDGYQDQSVAARAHNEINDSVTAAYRRLSALRAVAADPAGVIAQGLWRDEAEETDRAGEFGWDWPERMPMAEFRRVFEYLLSLDPASLDEAATWWPDPVDARQRLAGKLDELVSALDRHERSVHGRGGWPR